LGVAEQPNMASVTEPVPMYLYLEDRRQLRRDLLQINNKIDEIKLAPTQRMIAFTHTFIAGVGACVGGSLVFLIERLVSH
jgi:hypothetical protein